MKKLSLIALVAGIALLTAGVAMANIPAPPVNQTLGFDDTSFDSLDEDACRECHGESVADDHHLLYGSSMIGPGTCSLGHCSDTGAVCGGGAPCTAPATCIYDTCYINDDCAEPVNYCTRGQACPVGLCEDGTTSCELDDDCEGILGGTCDAAACPSYRGVPGECGQPVCIGGSMAPNNPNAGVYGCLTCHDQDTTGGVISFVVYNDCTVCHEYRGGANVHHLDSANERGKGSYLHTLSR